MPITPSSNHPHPIIHFPCPFSTVTYHPATFSLSTLPFIPMSHTNHMPTFHSSSIPFPSSPACFLFCHVCGAPCLHGYPSHPPCYHTHPMITSPISYPFLHLKPYTHPTTFSLSTQPCTMSFLFHSSSTYPTPTAVAHPISPVPCMHPWLIYATWIHGHQTHCSHTYITHISYLLSLPVAALHPWHHVPFMFISTPHSLYYPLVAHSLTCMKPYNPTK